ncbi:MAG: hypothetical protein FIA97_02150 [Methylococcaceae bacterium]|nr:hypothetical protein [Methylococcaceae bacterium]
MPNFLTTVREKSPLRSLKTVHPAVNALVVLLAIIMIWRGVWGLLDAYVFPGNPVLSNLVCLGMGALILYLDDFSLSDLKR